jgi:LemA protein
MNKKVVSGCGIVIGVFLVIAIILVISGIKMYNSMVTLDESVNEKWSQVENVYQRRLDLIPNLVSTVKGYAAHEKDTFLEVTQARSKVGGVINLGPKVLNDPALFQKFQAAQASLSSALQRLMVVVEKYPDLKANQNFLALQSQLEGTENRITVERQRFNIAARDYNTYIRKFPKAFLARIFGFDKKQYFSADKGAAKAPRVEF